MTRTGNRYIHGLKWETRFVISFIVVTCTAVVGMIYADRTMAIVILGLLAGLGITIAGVLRSLLRDDYLHTTSLLTIVALTPPFAFATVYIGLLTSWMQRVGFGPLMRTAVTSVMLWSVVAAGFQMSATESTVVLLVSFMSSVVRQLAGPSLYLLPWTLLIVTYIMINVVLT